MQFKDVLYSDMFIIKGIEIGAITADQVEDVMDCEIYTNCMNINSQDPRHVCAWSESGIAGMLMQSLAFNIECKSYTDKDISHHIGQAKEHIDSALLHMQKIIEVKNMIIAEKDVEINNLKTRLTSVGVSTWNNT